MRVFCLVSLCLLQSSVWPAWGQTSTQVPARVQPTPPAQQVQKTQAAQAAAAEKQSPTPPPEVAQHVQFTGNAHFTDVQLRTALADSLQQIASFGLSAPLADDTAFYLEVFYRRQGYPDVNVNYRISGNILLLQITEGNYYQLGQIEFFGDKTFPSSTLNEYMIGTTRARFSQFQKQLPFVQADLETGEGLLGNFYVSQGFPNANIQPIHTSRRGGFIDVTVPITEGPRYFFGQVNFTNDPGIPLKDLNDRLKSLPDQPYAASAVDTLQRDLTFIYKKNGHFNGTVTIDADLKKAVGNRVPVVITADPGPLFHFGSIVVVRRPEARLSPDFLPRRFAELQGEVYSPSALQSLSNQLILSGLFDTLDLRETAEPDDTVQLTFSPIESKQKELSYYGGYRTYDGLILGATYSDRNFDHNGRVISLTAEYTTRGPRGELRYENPWFLDSKYKLIATIGIDAKNQTGYSYTAGYSQLSLSRQWTKELETTSFFAARIVSLQDITIEPSSLVGPSSYRLGTAGLTQNYFATDSRLNPTKGFVLGFTESLGKLFDAELTFARLTERFTVYYPIGKSVIAGGVRFGVIVPSHSSVIGVPIEERFFSGGADTVRSFAERELGPKDIKGNPLGGIARSIFNVEYDFPVWDDVIGAVFFDAGGLGQNPFDSFSTGVGVGVRYNLPIGPIRADYGVNPSPRAHEDSGAFHLSFGFAF
ncbi:MAG: BamA/TamA family outer membrane protein [Verrucomicrobia bacterium]|nr:BamA/TamA family outer membrane protein [Verrucomicrobiota bacterium]